MKSRYLFVLTILPFSAAILGGCGDNHIPVEVVNLKTAVQYISEEKNYTLTFSGEGYEHELVYTEKSIGVVSDKYPVIDDIHIECDQGVYRLHYVEDDHIAGEIIPKGEKLWGNDNYRLTMFGVSFDFLKAIGDDVSSIEVKDKDFVMKYVYSIGYKLDDIPNIDSLTLSYSAEDGNKALTFDLVYLDTHIVYVAHDFGTSKNKVVEEFIKDGGKPLEVDSELKKMRTLIRGNNFMQAIYYFGEDESGYVATAYFHEHYYASNYYGSDSYTGVISFNSESSKLKGCYYFLIANNALTIYPQPLYEVPSVPEYYHYPTFLALLDNMEYIHDWTNQDFGGATAKGKGYFVNNKGLLNDFANNFSIGENFQGQVPIALGIDFVDDGDDTMVTFYYKFACQGGTYVMPIPLYNFGNVANATLDAVYETYND